METEVKSLWAATEASINEKEEEESAIQHAGKREASLRDGTLTAMAMEESLEQAVMKGAQIRWPLWSGRIAAAKVSSLTKPHDMFAKILLKAF